MQNELIKHGLAALIPGLQLAVEHLTELLTKYQELAAGLEGRPVARPRLGRPAGSRSGWPEDAEERKAEMARRLAARQKNLRGKAISQSAKARWAKMPKAQRAALLKKMQAGRAAAQQQHDAGKAKKSAQPKVTPMKEVA